MQDNLGGYNLGGINATGQVPQTQFSLIDKDTPPDAYEKASPVDGRTMQLVFSDEFEVEGRTFYPVSTDRWLPHGFSLGSTVVPLSCNP